MFLKGTTFIIPEARACIILVPNSTDWHESHRRGTFIPHPAGVATTIEERWRDDSLPQPARRKWPRVYVFRFPRKENNSLPNPAL